MNKYLNLAFVIIFSVCFKQAQGNCFDSVSVEVNDNDFLNLEEIYHYYHASGTVHFFTSNDGFNKPVIIVEGLDIYNTTNCDDIIGLLQSQQPIVSELNAQERDVVIVNFANNTRLIEENAVFLGKVIETINEMKEGDHSNTIVGLSMGGLVSRLALSRMEHYNKKHEVFLFVSYDSPQKFANLSQELQAWLNFGVNSAEGRMQLSQTLGSSAVKQMLVTRSLINYDETGTIAIFDAVDYNKKLMDKINSFGGYPKKLRKIAFSNGSALGSSDGAFNFDVGDPLMIIRGDFGQLSAVAAAAVGTNHYNTFLECMLDMNYVELVAVTSVPAGCALTGFYPAVVGENPQLSQLSFDNAPGSYSHGITDSIIQVITDLGFTVETPQPETSFIPTISALDINTNDLL